MVGKALAEKSFILVILFYLQVIWPYNSGEVIVQNYNAVLSLAHLYQSADAVIAIENDALHSICTRLLAIPKVSFQSINRVIAYQLASILAPACYSGSSTVIRNPIGMWLLSCFLYL
jgi:tubulin delta